MAPWVQWVLLFLTLAALASLITHIVLFLIKSAILIKSASSGQRLKTYIVRTVASSVALIMLAWWTATAWKNSWEPQDWGDDMLDDFLPGSPMQTMLATSS